MMTANFVFLSESVTEGHPDKLCDQISDALVDHYLLQDQQARVIAECAVSTGILFVAVKAAANAVVDVPNTARKVILDVGYDKGSFNGHHCTVMTNYSPFVNYNPSAAAAGLAADRLDLLVAQENATIFGYACQQTPDLMPLPVWLAHQLVRRLDMVRKQTLDYLAPDGNCQVGIGFVGQQPQRVDSITLVASQRHAYPPLAQLRADLLEEVIKPVFATESIAPDAQTRIQINPEGQVLEGGPALHAGLTGRKNGIDTYGGFSRQGSAALSGKDPTRIDRIAAYAARYAAKNVVAAGLAEQCEVLLSYSIGRAEPVSIYVNTFGAGRLPDEQIAAQLAEHCDFRLGGIIRRFNLRQIVQAHDGQFYRRLATYGQLGRSDLALPWEATDLAHTLR